LELLDVDLLGFETGDATRRRAIVDGVMRSLATGFVYVEHDLDETEIDTCYALLDAFFAAAPEVKARSAAPLSRGQRGYTGLLVEKAAGSDAADWKEHLNWGTALAANHPLATQFPDRYTESVFPEANFPGFAARMMSFHDRVADLQCRFLRIVAEGLGAPSSFFDAMTKEGATLTRAIHYPAMSGAPGASHVWAAEHGDINLVTALPRASAKGLEVKTVEGWKPVEPPPGHAVLNSGMMLEHISNGLIPTGLHRVVADPDQLGDRLSVVQFCHPTPDTILTPLPSCVTQSVPARFQTIAASDWLDDVLREIGLDAAAPQSLNESNLDAT
jgi:isopenicillin N synthase-like dioxygenase